jgi:hypothetical protein
MSFHVNFCTFSPGVQLDFCFSCYDRHAIKFLESFVINFESYKGLFARFHMYIHIYIYTYSFAGKIDFYKLFHTFLPLLCLISCYGSLFRLLDIQGVTPTDGVRRTGMRLDCRSTTQDLDGGRWRIPTDRVGRPDR